MRFVLLALGLSSFALPCYAQVTGDTCIKIAASVAVEDAKRLTTSQVNGLQYNTLCESHDSQSDAAVNILTEEFNFGGKLNQSEKQSYCKKDFYQLGISQADYIISKNVFREGLEVVRQCLYLASAGWDIKYQQYTDAVSVNIAFRGGSNELKGVDIIPSDSATCTGLPPLPARVNAEGISFICERKAHVSVDGQMTRTSADPSIINVRLGDQILALKMDAYSKSPVDAIQNSLAEANKQVNELRSENSTLKGKLDIARKIMSDSLDTLSRQSDTMTRAIKADQDAGDNSGDSHTCSRHGFEARDMMTGSINPAFTNSIQQLRTGTTLLQ